MGKLIATVDDDIKAEAAALYESLGMSLSTAVNVFLRQSIRENGMPFEPKRTIQRQYVPNEETRRAIVEAEAKELGLIADDAAASTTREATRTHLRELRKSAQ
ncbi:MULTISPECIES: type II toxin-antitoxin system RelB/DinJ family antitoxin [Bifidobacterium]|jgi:DNA-damage-inducible protein J|uniref:Type II toxin-antitoxin system RelB/DinJ family antitoxin n=1 Tax=Bifidobacterium tibiigranuli TaxID=2172043 RepID=A0A5N6RXU9_9BIFI|nr:type II toxin-antitoxin system RelB/DinJ family antitoxin [Bifidobacterium tibiigranuli]KAE8127248.1 damage-inducible protein J [Bifidobacterium tibiigranuli]KAE8129639.1 type II toxin-antitoxin system RelB/DinJ family antitoxin [Bifidobacterium tibiigranuli]MCH3975631.1 type II toxin-antitoxin system RelB/DinJ family antitoxin [Bifidobacterium tibiigranuli]MCH4189586.1 type II toxin-antitoxin system RelB/DinJ family antitoxin [Bifidobacterium tibiigranuli]MCH4204435.1 type II toxin-antitox